MTLNHGVRTCLEPKPRDGEWVALGDPDSRDALAVHADQLQAAGDPLGTWLAAWLAGPCKATSHHYDETGIRCTVCCGRGVVLGAYHEAIADWLKADTNKRLLARVGTTGAEAFANLGAAMRNLGAPMARASKAIGELVRATDRRGRIYGGAAIVVDVE